MGEIGKVGVHGRVRIVPREIGIDGAPQGDDPAARCSEHPRRDLGHGSSHRVQDDRQTAAGQQAILAAGRFRGGGPHPDLVLCEQVDRLGTAARAAGRRGLQQALQLADQFRDRRLAGHHELHPVVAARIVRGRDHHRAGTP